MRGLLAARRGVDVRAARPAEASGAGRSYLAGQVSLDQLVCQACLREAIGSQFLWSMNLRDATRASQSPHTPMAAVAGSRGPDRLRAVRWIPGCRRCSAVRCPWLPGLAPRGAGRRRVPHRGSDRRPVAGDRVSGRAGSSCGARAPSSPGGSDCRDRPDAKPPRLQNPNAWN